MGIYYRPVWTCGRYDQMSQSAIYFNLVVGLSYFFEDYSADVMGEVLSIPRGGKISVESLAAKTGIAVDSLTPFLFQLEENGLLSAIPTSPDVVANYRCQVKEMRLQELSASNSPDILTSDESNAEKCYANRCENRVTIAMLELTYRCSEKCIHCYNPGATRNDSEISYRNQFEELQLDEYKRIIDELYAEGLVRVCLSGGDPFSKSIIWEIIDYLYSKDIAFDIYTNGQNLIGYEEQLAAYFPCAIGVSIYSSVPNVHDSITRVLGSFNKSIKVIDKLSALSIPIEIKCCIMQTNLKYYWGVADLAAQYGATLQLECAIFDSSDGDMCVSKYLRLTEEQLEIVLRDKNNPLYIGPELPDYGESKLDMNDIGCRAGIQSFCITPDGNLTPCSSFHAVIGNLRKQHLNEILTNNSSLDWWANLELNKYEECGRHDYCAFCKLCPGLNFSEHGTPLKAAENNCYVAKVRYKLATRMKQGYDPLNEGTISDTLDSLPDNESITVYRIQSKNNFDKNLL
ncbi:radical SAM protein [Bacteroides sp. OttesenSCG-928-D19]|nr:radical SAM protein [Bacteroides sp. OttesenSCG-928-D19]